MVESKKISKASDNNPFTGNTPTINNWPGIDP